MYNAGITAADLIRAVKGEADISIAVPEDLWVREINTVEQFLYTELLKEYVSADIDYAEIVPLSQVPVPMDADPLLFDDIIKVFVDGVEIERAGVIGTYEFPEKNLYYTDYAGNICLSLSEYAEIITIVYRLRPKLKSVGSTAPVAVPPEFVDMVAAKMRGEAYKIANEDGLAAKWLADYNAQLESFKVWAATRNARYGG